ncbi:hypothetical protein JOS77_24345 [Chromobacterium haemolyticum]|nr:hypothetical protein JOS77_24345 [Chromobacterium haemolyticum]
MSNSIQLAVVGATGLVGQAVLELLAQRQLPVGRVFAVDTADKEGETAAYGNLELDVHPIDGFAFENVARWPSSPPAANWRASTRATSARGWRGGGGFQLRLPRGRQCAAW